MAAGESSAPRRNGRMAKGAMRSRFAPWNDPTAQPIVRFEAVSKHFGDTAAVDGVSLSIYEGEFFALLGPSGCGKSTLMRLLAGFEAPDAGQVLLEGKDLAGTPPHLRPVNMMFQSYALFPHLTVAENVEFGLRQEGMAKPQRRERVAEMLDLVKLTAFADRRPDQLSGGQKQRVALARSIAKRPKTLLLDEPLGALDKKLREETQFELMDLQAELGMTFIVVTHDQEEAMTMADRIAVMDHGRIVQVDPPEVIYEAPSCRFVAEFLGDVNLIKARVTGRENDRVLLASAEAPEGLQVAAGAVGVTPGDTVWLAVRPEKMTISPPGSRGPNRIRGVIWDIGYTGDWTTYLVRLPGGQTLRAATANATRSLDRALSWNDAVEVGFAPEAGIVLTS